MKDYFLYEKTWQDFENIVIDICEEILGIGVISFSMGTDEGRDGRYNGKSNKYPSENENWNGRWIIQSKHTEKIQAKLSDSDFKHTINKEIKRLKKLLKKEEINNYVVFTNRKQVAKSSEELIELIKKDTEIKNVQIIGEENISRYLGKYLKIVKKYDLGVDYKLDITPEDIKELILELNKFFSSKPKIRKKAEKFKIKEGFLEAKNKLNNLSEDYYNYQVKKYQIYFNELEKFLQNPRNNDIFEIYSSIRTEYNEEIILKYGYYSKFDEILNELFKQIKKFNPQLNKENIYLILVFMYCNCDIGKVPEIK